MMARQNPCQLDAANRRAGALLPEAVVRDQKNSHRFPAADPCGECPLRYWHSLRVGWRVSSIFLESPLAVSLEGCGQHSRARAASIPGPAASIPEPVRPAPATRLYVV